VSQVANQKKIALSCKISRGGFTDERVFRVGMADGETYIGACSRRYCYTKDKHIIKDEQPKRGETIDGLVLARHIRDEEGNLLVSVPDGAVLLVSESRVTEAPKDVSPDVLVQS
jgi:hypothetical protein